MTETNRIQRAAESKRISVARVGLVEQVGVLVVIPGIFTWVASKVSWIPLRIGLTLVGAAVTLLALVYGIRYLVSNWASPPERRTAPRAKTERMSLPPDGEGEVVPDRAGRRPLLVDASILGAVAAVSYAAARVALARFYGELGMSPEEAGWDLQRTLSSFGMVFLIVATGVTVMVTAATLIFNALSHSLGGHAGHTWRSHWVNGLLLGIAASAALLVSGLLTYPAQMARDVEQGRVADGQLLGLLTAAPKCVDVILPADVAGEAMVLLGHSGGIISVYDPDGSRLIRFASGETRIVSSDACEPAKQPWWMF